MARWLIAAVVCGALGCGKGDAPTPTEAPPAAESSDPAPGEDLHAWFVRWIGLLATAGETGASCADIGARWSDMADRARPHFAEIKRIEAAQSEADKQAFIEANRDRLEPARAKVQAAMERCKDDPAFEQALQNVRTLL